MVAGVTRKHVDLIHDDLVFYEHQIEGVRRMARMSSVILADEMGLGKSLQALTTAAVDFQKGYAAHVLIVCPAYLKWNWAAEIEEHTDFTYTVYHGTPKQREKLRAEFDRHILIVGYEQLVNDFAHLRMMPWDILIVDEAHMVKEARSKRSKAIHSLKVQRVFLLTGSPVLNRPNELFSLLHRCDPARFRSYWPFVNRYCVFGGFKGKQVVGVKNKRELREILAEYMIRRLKVDCLDLPDKQYITRWVELHPDQRKLYDEANKTLELALPDEPQPMEIENALVKMLKLKQIACTPACLGFEDHSYKLDAAIEDIVEFCMGDNPEHVVVFTQFRGVQEAMKLRLDAAGVPCWQLHGDIPMNVRMGVIDAWKKDTPGVLMIMLQMASGMNLTTARKALFLDKLYVPKLNEQAEDRIHRIGADTSQPVQIIAYVAKNTIEERIERILSKKRTLFKTLIEDVDNWKAILMEELRKQADEDAA